MESVKEWLASWGDGPHWADETGATGPITKESLAHLIESAERMRGALRKLQERALCHAPNSAREFAPATAASIAIICEDALEGECVVKPETPAAPLTLTAADVEALQWARVCVVGDFQKLPIHEKAIAVLDKLIGSTGAPK